jgi:predicted amino acid dehydrogenase
METIVNGPSREELNAKVAANAADTAAQIARLEGKMDRMMAEMHKALADNLKWTVGLVCVIIALSMSMLNFMMRSYIDEAVRKAVDERLPAAEQRAGHTPDADTVTPPTAGKAGY